MTHSQLLSAMETFGSTVYRLSLCRLQNISDAEDVYQDVFLRLLEQDASHWDDAHTKAWLIRTTLNRCADLGRFRLRRPTVPLEAIAECSATVDSRHAEVWEAVSALPVKLRTAVHLHYAEGYSTEEIAHLLSVPPATVRTRLRRAREKLKNLLGGDDDV